MGKVFFNFVACTNEATIELAQYEKELVDKTKVETILYASLKFHTYRLAYRVTVDLVFGYWACS